ncbi:unnamed protein product [Paramecium sonneborni]|uniref:AB hydrolase-1 domain-containing protein n=1 Tax=Paramecium sonneborni TaxID=65129 RepID=A0A8S1QJX0_9CILI|nr:unnamed protein product [Paramecium sonneborni]
MFITIIRSTTLLQLKPKVGYQKYLTRLRTVSLAGVITMAASAYYCYECFWNTSLEFIHHPEAIEKHLLSIFGDIKYRPTFYIPHRLLQLAYATRWEQKIETEFERQLFKLSDGGQLALDWKNKHVVTKKPLILITHGLTGGSETNYIKHAAETLAKAGYQVVCFNQRGVANCELLTSKYHFHGCTNDLREVINYLQENKQKGQQIFGLGFSIGGSLLLKYAGEEGYKCKVNRIFSVANPYDLLDCSHNIMKFRNKIYDWSITCNFKMLLKQHQNSLADNQKTKGIQIEEALQAKNTYQFDELITRRLFDFDSPEQLYSNIGCGNYIKDVKVPVFIMHAKDDPIVPQFLVPYDQIKQNPNIIVALTNKGAHVEWFTGFKPQRWIMNPILKYFEEIQSL